MGFAKLERRRPEYWRGLAETVGQLRALGWDVTCECAACRLAMRVDLRAVEAVAGAETSLWNRRARCRRLGCEGRVSFFVRPPELLRPLPMQAEWPSGRAAHWWRGPG